MTSMAKSKQQQQKQKERERRVAQEKLAAVAQKRSQEKTATESGKKPPSRTAKVMTGAAGLKPAYVADNAKSPAPYRRTGG
jgi:3'-phosphoadenosine 5'-phosphosulfate (PAPS) 3'-phosphatase